MGLDMYLFKINKLNNKELAAVENKHVDEIARDYHILEAESFEREAALYGDLEGLARKTVVKRTEFLFDKCLKDYGISEDDVLYGRSTYPDGMTLDFKSGAKIELKKEEYQSYLEIVDAEVYIFKCESVAYWRKDYNLDDFFYTLFDVENCAYHKLDNDGKAALKAYLKEHQPEDFKHNLDVKHLNSKTSNLFYYAWW